VVQIHFLKVTLLAALLPPRSTHESVRGPEKRGTPADAHRVGSLVLPEVVITCIETACMGAFGERTRTILQEPALCDAL